MRTIAASATAALLFCSVPFASSQQQPSAPSSQPTFRSGVDLLTLQASVVDKAGRPITDLTADDFSVTVEGKPRKVLFAKFRGMSTASMAQAATAAPAAAAAAHADNTASAGGRLVMFIIDRDSIRSGGEKALLESSTAILGALSPADAVGLVSIPTGGIDATRDHARVREELKRITGTQPTTMGGGNQRDMSFDEALGFERGDQTIRARVIERECRPSDGSPCIVELEGIARTVVSEGRGHAQTVLQVIDSLLSALAPIRGPKHIVLLSGGQAFDQDLLPQYNEFARRAAAAQVMLHAVHIDQPNFDVTNRSVVTSLGGREGATGLTTMTGMTGGAYYAGVGTATGVFDRIRTEIANDYELGLETAPSDADDKLHDVSVKVNRPDVSVRARKQIVLAKTATANADTLSLLLGQPTDIADLPIAFASYTTRGLDPATLRVLLSAEIGSSAASEWAFAVFDKGKVIADGRQELAGETARRIVTTSLQLAPGRYRIRVAATGPDGRNGVIDAPLTVGLRAAGKLQMSDLIVGTSMSGRLQPQSRIIQGQRLAALLETLSADVAALEKTRVAMEILPAAGGEPVQRLLMASRSGGSDVLLLSEAQIDTTALAPGRYVASAIALVDTQPVGRVSRVFEVVADAVK